MKYLIEPYLPAYELHILSGRSGVGKTHLLFQFLDAHRDQLGEIAYFAADRSIESHKEIFTKLKIAPFPVYGKVNEDTKRPYVNVLGDVESYQATWNWFCRRYAELNPKPSLIILDPAQRFVPCKNLNSVTSAGGGLAAIATWAVSQQTTILFLWHPSKVLKSNLNDPYDCIAGSHGVQGYTSTKAILEAPSNAALYYNLHVRGQHFDDVTIKLVRNEAAFRLAEADEISHNISSIDELGSAVLLLPLFNEGEYFEVKELLKRALLAGAELSRRTAYRRLDLLIEAGNVSKQGNGYTIITKCLRKPH